MVSVYTAPRPLLSVTSHRSTSLVPLLTSRCWVAGVTTSGGPDAWPVQARAGPAIIWCDQAVASVQCLHAGEQWWSPVSQHVMMTQWSVIIIMMDASKSPSVWLPGAWCVRLPEGDPMWWWALLPVLARQVSPGQEPLTYIFTFLSWSLALKFWDNRQSETRWQDTGIHHTHYRPHATDLWQWEVNNDNPGIFKRPWFFICNEMK